MTEKEKITSDPFIDLLRADEEILWLGKSEPMSLMRPLMRAVKICAIWGLILLALAFWFTSVYPVKGNPYDSGEPRSVVETFLYFLRVSLPVILIGYGFYWWWTQYEPVATYAVTNQRIMIHQGRKTTVWKHAEIKKIDIVGDEHWASMTFTRVGGDMSTWHDVTESETILEIIRARVKTPVFVDHIEG
jgi:hypothetical protein